MPIINAHNSAPLLLLEDSTLHRLAPLETPAWFKRQLTRVSLLSFDRCQEEADWPTSFACYRALYRRFIHERPPNQAFDIAWMQSQDPNCDGTVHGALAHRYLVTPGGGLQLVCSTVSPRLHSLVTLSRIPLTMAEPMIVASAASSRPPGPKRNR